MEIHKNTWVGEMSRKSIINKINKFGLGLLIHICLRSWLQSRPRLILPELSLLSHLQKISQPRTKPWVISRKLGDSPATSWLVWRWKSGWLESRDLWEVNCWSIDLSAQEPPGAPSYIPGTGKGRGGSYRNNSPAAMATRWTPLSWRQTEWLPASEHQLNTDNNIKAKVVINNTKEKIVDTNHTPPWSEKLSPFVDTLESLVKGGSIGQR